MSGVLVKRNFNYHIMAPSDLPTYTDLAMSTVTQRQSVSYTGTLNQLQYYLNQLSADVETSGDSLNAVRVFGGAVTVTLEPHKKNNETRCVYRLVHACKRLIVCVITIPSVLSLQCFDAVGWAAGRASGL